MTENFLPMDFGRRIRLAREALSTAEVDALIVTNLVNARWLTGFTGSAGLVLLTRTDLTLVTDGRYAVQAPEEVATAGSGAEIEITSHEQKKIVTDRLRSWRNIALEADHVTWSRQQAFANDWLKGKGELIPTTGLVDNLRRQKDAGEIDRMQRAASIADQALAAVRPTLRDRPTERAFAGVLDAKMRELGASGAAFETIVASGPNGARPHHRPGDRHIEPHELVVIDVGATVEGYRSDMTRTYSVGEPTAEARRMYEAVIAAQEAGVVSVGVDVPTADVDSACRAVLADAGLDEAFTHGTGHGVGLDIHEAPRVGARAVDVLAAGDVITVEPGVYLPEHGGVRIEDTLVVGSDGGRRLTLAPKELVVT